jgi:hypothetical protein
MAIYKIICDPKQDENIFSQFKNRTLTSEKELKELLKDSDMTYLAFFYKKSSPNSKLVANILPSIAEKINYLAGILLIDCDNYETDNTKLCKAPEGIEDAFPKMMLYVPPEYKYNPYTKQINEHSTKYYEKNEVSEAFIYNFITHNIPSRSYALTNENHETFLANSRLNKVILFTEKPKTPLLWRGLSTYFHDKLAFGHVGKEQDKLIKTYKVEKFPTIIIHQVHEEEASLESPIIDKYEGKFEVEELAHAFETYALKEKLTGKNSATKHKAVFKKLNKDDYAAYFKKFPEKRFVVYLSENDDIPEGVNKFNTETAGFFQFVKLNCSNNFCKTFKFKILPQLIMFKYNPKEDLDTQISTSKILPNSDYNKIYKEISDLFSDSFTAINSDSFQSIIYETIMKQKFPLIYLYDNDEVPLGLHLLSTDASYKKYLEFILFEKPHTDIIRQFKLQKLPQLVFVIGDSKQPESAKLLPYTDELNYSSIRSYIDQVNMYLI